MMMMTPHRYRILAGGLARTLALIVQLVRIPIYLWSVGIHSIVLCTAYRYSLYLDREREFECVRASTDRNDVEERSLGGERDG
jgi:hypothetical protein